MSFGLPPLWLLVGISALGPIVMNAVLPANTQIMHEFETKYGLVQLVLTVYLVATMFSQIIMGNLADRYGRRPIMLINLLIFALGGVICTVAFNIEMLLVGRFVQGFGASVCMFLPRTIVRDVYGRDRAASVIGYMTTAMMAAPLFGPALGGWVTDVSSWRWMYALLAVLGCLFAYLTWMYQNETLIVDERERRPIGSQLFQNAKSLLSTRMFVAYLLVQCGSVGVYYSFLGGAPYVLMELRGLSASEYGLWFMVIAVGYLLGNLAAGKFSERIGVDRMIGFALLPGAVGMTLFWLLFNWDHPLGLFLPMQLITFSNGMCLPNVMSAIMSVRPDMAGGASGLAGTIQTAVGIVFTLLLSIFLLDKALPLYVLMSLSACLCVLGYARIRQHA